MHKSTGSSVTGVDALHITPAAVMNYIVLRVNPSRHIDYDSGAGILDMVDEYDRVEAMYYNSECQDRDKDLLRAYELSQPEGPRASLPLQIPYRHLVSLVQIADGFDGILAILRRMNMVDDNVDPEDQQILKQRIDCVNYWLNGFAPDNVKFEICQTLPDCEISAEEKSFFAALLEPLSASGWGGEDIHNAIYQCAKETTLGPKGCFQALYKIFCNQKQGPRLGFFFSTIEKDFVIARIKEASN